MKLGVVFPQTTTSRPRAAGRRAPVFSGKGESRGAEPLWQGLKGMCPFSQMPEGLP